MQPPSVVWLDFMGWVISYAYEWEDYSNCFWEVVEISRNWTFNNFYSLATMSVLHVRGFNALALLTRTQISVSV